VGVAAMTAGAMLSCGWWLVDNNTTRSVVEVVLNSRRNVPYFYNTLWVIKFILVLALILRPKQPWWSVALAHTIAWCITMPQLVHMCHPHTMGKVWVQSILWVATGTWSHHHRVFVRLYGETVNTWFTMIFYE
jgi:hypothetical protein